MSQKLREQLSALMDGELDDNEARFLLQRLSGDPELRGIWDRYHRCQSLISASDRADGDCALLERAFSSGVMDAIEREAQPEPQFGRWRDWMRPVAGLAVAASVATVALLGLQGERLGGGGETADVVPGPATDRPTWGSPARFQPAAVEGNMSPEERDSWQLLNTYRINHAEQTAGLRRMEAEAESDAPDDRDPEGNRR